MSYAADFQDEGPGTANVHRLSVEPLAPRKLKQPAPTATTPEPPTTLEAHPPAPEPEAPPQPVAPVRTENDMMLAAFRTIAKILSARGLIFSALIGAFIIAGAAVIKGGVLPLIALGIYALTTVIPLVYLEVKGR